MVKETWLRYQLDLRMLSLPRRQFVRHLGPIRVFADRVRLYAALDQKLHTVTRFFGAAALTNTVLVELCSLPCPSRWACHLAIDYLGVIGTALEGLNIQLSQHIEYGRMAARDLDCVLVKLEQLAVEELLRQHESPHLQSRALEQINRLLHWAHRLAPPLRHCPGIRIYGQVLGHLHARLGRPANFARLDDRIGIGHALTRLLREQHGPRLCARTITTSVGRR